MRKPEPPPNYKMGTTNERCINCRMGYHWQGTGGWCSGYDEPGGHPYKIRGPMVCDSWARDSNYKAQAKE